MGETRGEQRVYLVRHGEAQPSGERPLSRSGAEDVARVAAWSAGVGLQIDEIRHSGKLRAQQTAEIFARHVQVDSLRAVRGLAPNDDVLPMRAELDKEPSSVMVVGHLPFMGRLASLLVTGESQRDIVRFEAGAMLVLTRQEGGWTIEGVMQPRLLPR